MQREQNGTVILKRIFALHCQPWSKSAFSHFLYVFAAAFDANMMKNLAKMSIFRAYFQLLVCSSSSSIVYSRDILSSYFYNDIGEMCYA